MADYKCAFPDFDYDIYEYWIEGFVDVSNKGDACPCMTNERVTIWFDYLNPDKRAIKGARRFTLADNGSLDIILETGNFEKVRKLVLPDSR